MRRSFLGATFIAMVVATTSAQAAGPRLNVSTYRAKANAICRDLNSWQPPPSGTLVDQMARGLEKGRSSLAALRRLRPPTTLASLHTHLVADRNRGLAQLGSLITKYKAGTITLAEMNAQLNDPPWQAKDNALWAKIGATACIRR